MIKAIRAILRVCAAVAGTIGIWTTNPLTMALGALCVLIIVHIEGLLLGWDLGTYTLRKQWAGWFFDGTPEPSGPRVEPGIVTLLVVLALAAIGLDLVASLPRIAHG